MNTLTRSLVIFGVAAAALSVTLAGVWLSRNRPASFYTDGETIRTPADGAPLRSILWQPARAIAGDVNTGADEYEPRISADGTLMVLVRGKPGHDANLLQSRWTPSGWTAPTPVEEVNSAHDELGPELSRDGLSLYFYSDRPGGVGGYDLWVSRREGGAGGGWGVPVNLGPAVNSEANEYGPALDPDATTLYFASNRVRPGEATPERDPWGATVRETRERHDYDLYCTSLGDSGAADARPVLELNTPADEGAPAYSPAADFLYFASNRPGGLGGFDLYRARRTGSAFGPAMNVGDALNSPMNDLDPALSMDGFRLHFSSNRETGSGSIAQDYGVWVSHSREVYLHTEPMGGSFGDLMGFVVPWLLLLLLSLLLALLLLRLWQTPRLRTGFARLSLLAQCLLVSLALHILVASLLALWRVRAEISELMADRGGTRVVLASASESDDFSAQLRSEFTEERAPASFPEVAGAELVGAEIDVPVLRTDVEATPQPLTTLEISAPEPARADAARPSDAQARIDAASPEPLASLKTPETPATAAPVGEQEISPHVPRATASATPNQTLMDERTVLDAPATDVRTIDAPVLLTGTPRSASAAAPSAPLASRAPMPDAAAAAAQVPPVPVAATASSEPVMERREAIQNAVAPAPVVAAPGESMRIATAVASEGGVEDRSAPEFATVGRTTEIGPSSTLSPTSVALAPVAVIRAAAPRVLPAQGNAPSDEPKVESGGAVSLVMAVISPAPSASGAGQTVRTEAPASHVAEGARLEIKGARPETAPSLSAPQGGLRAIVATPGVTVSLPIAEDPPAPKETFAQRAPEVRTEILDKMGGTADTERAVGLALDWFARHQESDGRWTGRGFDAGCGRCDGAAEFDSDAAMTGLALLCYLGAGHTHDKDGPYRAGITRALEYLLARQEASGDLRRGETMYSQSIATVALCEAYSMTRDARIGDAARRAVAFMCEGVKRAASRRQDERSRADDTSVLGWQVMAMESARRSGFTVPETTFRSAGVFLDKAASRGNPGRYAYRPGEEPSAAMTAEAMFVRQLMKHDRGEARMRESAAFILETPPRWKEGASTYYWYYATLALFQHQGEAWKRWNEAIVPELLANQRTDAGALGSWDPQDQYSRMGGRLYQTAVCTLSLEVYYRYTPAGTAESER